MRVEYHSNNSGGGEWLSVEDWRALAEAGWTLHRYEWRLPGTEHGGMVEVDPATIQANGSRWDNWPSYAYKTGDDVTLGEAIREFDRVTSCRSSDLGCSCCGPPHEFSLRDDEGAWIDSYSPSYPVSGEAYSGD